MRSHGTGPSPRQVRPDVDLYRAGEQWLASYIATSRNPKGQRLAITRFYTYLLPNRLPTPPAWELASTPRRSVDYIGLFQGSKEMLVQSLDRIQKVVSEILREVMTGPPLEQAA